jgi:hypothetical protein
LVSFFGEAKKETPVRRGQTAVGTSAKGEKTTGQKTKKPNESFMMKNE